MTTLLGIAAIMLAAMSPAMGRRANGLNRLVLATYVIGPISLLGGQALSAPKLLYFLVCAIVVGWGWGAANATSSNVRQPFLVCLLAVCVAWFVGAALGNNITTALRNAASLAILLTAPIAGIGLAKHFDRDAILGTLRIATILGTFLMAIDWQQRRGLLASSEWLGEIQMGSVYVLLVTGFLVAIVGVDRQPHPVTSLAWFVTISLLLLSTGTRSLLLLILCGGIALVVGPAGARRGTASTRLLLVGVLGYIAFAYAWPTLVDLAGLVGYDIERVSERLSSIDRSAPELIARARQRSAVWGSVIGSPITGAGIGVEYEVTDVTGAIRTTAAPDTSLVIVGRLGLPLTLFLALIFSSLVSRAARLLEWQSSGGLSRVIALGLPLVAVQTLLNNTADDKGLPVAIAVLLSVGSRGIRSTAPTVVKEDRPWTTHRAETPG